MLHQLLLEQLKASFGENLNFSPEMLRFIEQVNQSYLDFNSDANENTESGIKNIASTEAKEILQLLESAQDLFYTTDKK